MKEVFEIGFNKDSFVENVGDAIKSTKSLDEALSAVSTNAKAVNFSKPISELAKFETSIKEVFTAMQKESKMTNAEIDKSVKDILASKKNITSFLSGLKKQLKTTKDTAEFKDLKKQIALTENAIKELSGETVTLDVATKSAKTRLKEMKAALIEMEDAGDDNTEMYRKLTIDSA
jgi:predicted Rossmann fold nucleotide-binding protein DprA/Smf involved in DNA uptake